MNNLVPKIPLKEYYNIKNDVSFVNAKINGDIKRFIDPSFLLMMDVTNFDSKMASRKIRSFFTTVMSLYRKGQEKEALQLFTSFQENNAFGLGYALNSKKGRGLSEDMARKFFKQVYNLTELEQSGTLLDPAVYRLFIQDFDKDRFTDLITAIIGKELMDYSVLEAVELDLPLSASPINLGTYWDNDAESFQHLVGRCLMAYGSPIILVPYCLLTKKYAYTIEGFINRVVLPAKKAKYADENEGKTITNTKLKEQVRADFPEHGYLKAWGLQEVIEHPDYLAQYLHFVNKMGAMSHSIPLDSCDDVA